MNEEIRIVKYVRKAGYDNVAYFKYEIPEGSPLFTEQRADEKNKVLLKKVNSLVHGFDNISRNENGDYVVVGSDLEKLLSAAKIELQKEKERRIEEAEKNREKNRKLAQADYDIFAWDREEEKNLNR